MQEACRAFVRRTTEPKAPTLTPELLLYVAHSRHPYWHMDEADLEASYLPPPYWGFAWSGGQALARYVLDHPHLVSGKRILNFASGAGLEAVAAARAGASHVFANDICPLAEAAVGLNAELNHTQITFLPGDIIGTPQPTVDVLLAGDICYEGPLASSVMGWFRELTRAGTLILVGDPGRAYLPKIGLQEVVRYHPAHIDAFEDGDLRRAAVHRVLA